jgi:hypothetical protein
MFTNLFLNSRYPSNKFTLGNMNAHRKENKMRKKQNKNKIRKRKNKNKIRKRKRMRQNKKRMM